MNKLIEINICVKNTNELRSGIIQNLSIGLSGTDKGKNN